ncbi:MAG TPA: inositol monophosphatase family protein [Ignavibacteria bacterium]|nr:inositol monophosphatase family protein [Ignavibacteria bacterium]
MENLTQYKKVMFEAADEAVKILKQYFETDLEIGRKRDYNDLVTNADKQCEAKISEIINNYYPEHNLLGEEGGDRKKNSDYVWIVDPIDGTINYAHSVPIFCVSIALEIKGEVVMGVVQSPMTNEKFRAVKGEGAYLNDKKISVSDTEYLKDSLLVTGFPYGAKDNMDHCIDHFVNFIRLGLPIRRLGSAAMDICYLACGRFDGFWEINLNAWDVAAGYLILKEAGGKVTDFFGKDYSIYDKQILATNGRKIHDEMIKVLGKAYK